MLMVRKAKSERGPLPLALARRNNALITRIAALRPANSAETDLAASRAESRDAEGRSA